MAIDDGGISGGDIVRGTTGAVQLQHFDCSVRGCSEPTLSSDSDHECGSLEGPCCVSLWMSGCSGNKSSDDDQGASEHRYYLAYYDICVGGFQVHDLTWAESVTPEELDNSFSLCESCGAKVNKVTGRGFTIPRCHPVSPCVSDSL